jgi:signal transduction histidine kinase
MYVATLSRLGAAALLVIGGATSLRAGVARWPIAIVVGPALGVLAAVALAPLWAPLVPPLMGPVAARATDQSVTDLPHSTLANVLAQLQFAFYPSAFTGVTTSGDLFYFAFDLILLLGIEAETRAYAVSLRQANLGLEQLREAEVERAAMEERARLSRELHDGLAQDLWFAKLKVGRLAALPDLEPEARQLCAELDSAIDSGLVEARQAVMALRSGSGSDASFTELMTRFVDDFADRYGIPVELACDDVPRLDAHVEAELLRIAQEALSNVRRHADATVVWVRVSVEEGRVVISVRDNGKGFDPGAVGSSGFGLTSMAERAARVGGRLKIASRASDGTVVSVDVALPPIAGPGPTRPAGVVA